MTKLKTLPFDLEKALAGAKLVTRDGREVTEFKKDLSDSKTYPYSSDCFTMAGIRITNFQISTEDE